MINAMAASPVRRRTRRGEKYYGTASVGFIYKGGIILCEDSRVTQGNILRSQSMIKAFPVSNQIVATVAGRPAECSFWIRTLAWESGLHELKHNEPLPLLSAATFISNAAMDEKMNGHNLGMGMILAGKDVSGPGLIRIDCEGFIYQGSVFAIGSGSESALGVLDDGFHYHLNDKEAYDLAYRAVYYAGLASDTTGGAVSLHHFNKTNWKTVGIIDCQRLHNNFTLGLNYAGEEIEDMELIPSKRFRMA
ncbi:proteasome subunit beta type-5-like [Drosophila serrata]|uniref:proteasome subunit beta type-5-like n=1 Tax=Drosophila serrata TaxID=7274 RepID=UPI000A1D0A1D|nr:proteasome subunit beta type-5-like [Drosophila serrata]XP_020807785.1 proteasome subunit beta type-5-like [Drosophila serrata]KAH8368921.1 hypothetical protein KR200_004111 [Drosophila serrata]